MSDGSFHSTYINILPSLRRFISRIVVRPHDVDDVLQETFVRVSDKDFDKISSPKAYLFRAAKNIALNELTRKSKSVVEYADIITLSEYPDDTSALDEQVHHKIQLEVFSRSINSLPKKCRHVFLLRKVYGLSHQEISKRLGISKSGVEKHLATGVLKSREYMEEQGYSMSDLHLVSKKKT
ncbi:MAG: RNA polymerase sigma factor [Kordiimonadaceae bacterium]|nr:RNA polymerase sigma factor [Kordiimonadaceae bacterium]